MELKTTGRHTSVIIVAMWSYITGSDPCRLCEQSRGSTRSSEAMMLREAPCLATSQKLLRRTLEKTGLLVVNWPGSRKCLFQANIASRPFFTWSPHHSHRQNDSTYQLHHDGSVPIQSDATLRRRFVISTQSLTHSIWNRHSLQDLHP